MVATFMCFAMLKWLNRIMKEKELVKGKQQGFSTQL